MSIVRFGNFGIFAASTKAKDRYFGNMAACAVCVGDEKRYRGACASIVIEVDLHRLTRNEPWERERPCEHRNSLRGRDGDLHSIVLAAVGECGTAPLVGLCRFSVEAERGGLVAGDLKLLKFAVVHDIDHGTTHQGERC